MNLKDKIDALEGPILVIGASGFIGTNIFRQVVKIRDDVFGTTFSGSGWRLNEFPTSSILHMNILDKEDIKDTLKKIKPKTIFDCCAFGSYPFETNYELIHKTNFTGLIDMFEIIEHSDVSSYIHAGTSSEYGLNSKEPFESAELVPNSQYAISKAAASAAIKYYGKIRKIPVLNLRLYSVYGPYEDSSKLIPVLCKESLRKKLPPFANKTTSRDFIYIDDVVDAFVTSSLKIHPDIFGESINIGSGREITLFELARITKDLFKIKEEPKFSSSIARHWDTDNWYANTSKAKELLDWEPTTTFEEGLTNTFKWWKNINTNLNFDALTKKKGVLKKNSITAIIACYKDELAIPIMYEKLVKVFREKKVDYEIIFVNDCSPDNSHSIIKDISSKDPRVIGITHSRNFGSQAAFLSGLEMANKEACVLLDGDLQDPPELIPSFMEEWKKGAEVVYGRRIKREMMFGLEMFYKTFYFIFDKLSDIQIPRNAGDFSLIDKKVVRWILECSERDFFLRGIRAYVGFKQVGVDYVRAERMFGKSTNSLIKNVGWAKKAIFSFSQLPLHLLTLIGGIATFATFVLGLYIIFLRIYDPTDVPQGITFLGLLVMFFGSCTLFGLGLLGEYIGKILEESKLRPRFIRNKIIMRGSETSE